MKVSHNKTFVPPTIFTKQALILLFLCCNTLFNANALKPRVLVASTDRQKGHPGLFTNPDGTLVVCSNPNFASFFEPSSRRFLYNDFMIQNFGFADDVARIPADATANIPSGYALTLFLSGQIPFVTDDGDVIQTNLGATVVAAETGIYKQLFDPGTQGVNPLAYRASNHKIYFQSFDPTVIFYVDVLGSFTSAVTLNFPVGLNGMQFGPDDKLYAPDLIGNQIVKIDVDTGVVTPIISGLTTPIAAKVASNGIVFFIERTTGNVYKLDPTTGIKTLITTLQPALDNLCLSLSERKLFITNDQNKIYKVNINTGNTKVLFESPITQPWDITFDKNSIYIGDSGALKKVSAKNGTLESFIIFDSSANPGLNGFGTASGLDIDAGTGANKRITMADITIGNIVSFDKDFSNGVIVREFISGFETGLFTKQNMSTLRITSTTVPTGEYFLALNAVDGHIVKIYRDSMGVAQVSTYFSGLSTPVKLKLHNDYIYIVEAGELNQGIPKTGRVSRIPLSLTPPLPASQEVLVDNLDNPQGLAIYHHKMLILEVGTGKLLQASASWPSTPSVVFKHIQATDAVIISALNPVPVNPPSNITVSPNGRRVYFLDTHNNIVYKLKRKPC